MIEKYENSEKNNSNKIKVLINFIKIKIIIFLMKSDEERNELCEN